MATDHSATIKSNDGQTVLRSLSSNAPMTVTITSTGCVIADSYNVSSTYTYSGTKTFIGLASTKNATTPNWVVGDVINVTGVTIYYIVEAEPAPKVSIDVTTLSGYESLAAGTYQLAVRAKAAGYQDSDLSSTVSFTKLAAPVATASDTTVTWDAITNAESYDVYVDGELYENTTGGVTYNITTTVTNGTYSGDTTITDTATVTITANTGYTLPDSVTVTGASQTWNKETGTLTLSNPTGNVTVEAVCIKTTYTLKFTGGNSSMSGTLNGETIERYTEYTLKNGDVITLKAAGAEDHYLVDHYYKGNVIIDDVTYSNNSTITIKNKDIYATSTLTSSSSNISTTITINFVIE